MPSRRRLAEFVAENRADATMAERITYEAYASQLPTKLVNVARDKPIRRYSNSFLVAKNQHDFIELLDSYIEEQLRNGTIARIVHRYTGDEDKGISVPGLA